MRQYLFIIIILFIASAIFFTCKKPYNPPAVKVDNKFLVVDGLLISSADSPSVITLSRTTKLTDTTNTSFPETGAGVSVEGDDGENISFSEQGNGVYTANPLLLNASAKYRLKITTSSGDAYASDFTELKQTPQIDSLSWQQQNDVTVYLYTHDPSNNTKYYRWDYVETWQYRSPLERSIAQKNGLIYYTDSSTQTYNCWMNESSASILTNTSIALSQDVISKQPLTIVPQNSEKISVRYSILVKQYALTDQAFEYFSVLKKNTENLGSIFDAQPSQLEGNIHSLKNPSEIVIGFFTASSVQQKRLFINKNEVTNWNYIYSGPSCEVINIPQDANNFLLYNYADTAYAPYYYGSMPDVIFLAKNPCIDCTVFGGSPHKPVFW